MEDFSWKPTSTSTTSGAADLESALNIYICFLKSQETNTEKKTLKILWKLIFYRRLFCAEGRLELIRASLLRPLKFCAIYSHRRKKELFMTQLHIIL